MLTPRGAFVNDYPDSDSLPEPGDSGPRLG
jgi:hypothetical protein